MATNKVIATDLDGTLFYPRKRFKMISNETKEFCLRFLNDGGRLLLVSGRNRNYGEKVCRALGRELDMVMCNGALVVSNGHVIKESTFDKDLLKKMLSEICSSYRIPVVILFTKHRNMVTTNAGMSLLTGAMYSTYQFLQGVYRETIIQSEKVFREELEKGEVYKVMLIFGAFGKAKRIARKANKELRERYPEAEFSWSSQAIEVTTAGTTKSNGIAFYLEYNGIPADNVLVVGDSGNDISMFEAFKDGSYCMSHSPETIQKHASHIIKRFVDLEDYVYPSVETDSHMKKEKK